MIRHHNILALFFYSILCWEATLYTVLLNVELIGVTSVLAPNITFRTERELLHLVFESIFFYLAR